jgi:hypothetical protein
MVAEGPGERPDPRRRISAVDADRLRPKVRVPRMGTRDGAGSTDDEDETSLMLRQK